MQCLALIPVDGWHDADKAPMRQLASSWWLTRECPLYASVKISETRSRRPRPLKATLGGNALLAPGAYTIQTYFDLIGYAGAPLTGILSYRGAQSANAPGLTFIR